MKQMQKKLLSLLCALLLAVPFGVGYTNNTVHAESVQDKINKATKEKQEALEKKKEAQEQKDDLVAKSQKVEQEIDLVQSEIYEIDNIINDADQEIQEKEAEITEYENRIADQDEAFKDCLRSMDEMTTGSYLELLFSSKSFSEFLINLETIKEITQHDMAVIDDMTELKNNVEAAKSVVETKKSEQEEARGVAAEKQESLEGKLQEQEALMKELESDIVKYDQWYQKARAEEESLKASLTPSLSKTSDAVKYSGGVFCWPAPSYVRVSSQFGYRIHPIYKTKKYHSGLDLAAPGGSDILAAADGVVKLSRWNGGYGNCVVVDHGGGISTLYGHASRNLVSAGQTVKRGQVIAKVGTTGASTGNHLHFEVLVNGKATDPWAYLK